MAADGGRARYQGAECEVDDSRYDTGQHGGGDSQPGFVPQESRHVTRTRLSVTQDRSQGVAPYYASRRVLGRRRQASAE